MRRLLLLAPAILILALPALAQEAEWQFDTIFPPDTLGTGDNGIHGVAVDAQGKIWLQPFDATGEVDGDPVRQLFVFEPDGTEVEFSPITFVVYADGSPTDTLGTRSGRGLRADHQGNILVSQGLTLFKLDHTNGQGLARADFTDYCALTQAAADANGHVYVAPVCPGPPIRELDADLNVLGNVRDAASNFSRAVEVSPDGLTFYETMFENTYTIIHERADEFSAFDSVGVAFRGMRVESPAIHPVTGNLWVSAGNNLNLPNEDEEADRFWRANTWYEFDRDDLTMPLDSIVWHGCIAFDDDGLCIRPGDDAATDAAARPRGIGFSPDGNAAYVGAFTAATTEPGGNSQRHIRVTISTEPGVEPVFATLSQNYPNPFASSTTIEFEIEQPGHVTLRVFDLLGRQVAVLVDDALPADSHVTTLEAGSLATGTYLYTLEVDGQRLTSRRMLVVR